MSEGLNTPDTKHRFGKSEKKPLPDGVTITYEGSQITQTMDTLQAALELSGFSAAKNRERWAKYKTENRGAEWLGIEGGIAAVDAAIRDGWQDGADKMRRAMEDIGDDIAKPMGIRRARIRKDIGQEVDMQAIWRGRADVAWTDCRRTARPASQNITIAANITAMSYVAAGNLFWRGAAVLKLSELLTEAGYHVRIIAVRKGRNSYRGGVGLLQKVTVKEATAPLDINALAATVCLAGFFRTILFRCQCATNLFVPKSMGHSLEYEGDGSEIVGVERCMSKDKAKAWVIEQIRKIDGHEQQA